MCGHTRLDNDDGLVEGNLFTRTVFIELDIHIKLSSNVTKGFVQSGIQTQGSFTRSTVVGEPAQGGVDFMVQFTVTFFVAFETCANGGVRPRHGRRIQGRHCAVHLAVGQYIKTCSLPTEASNDIFLAHESRHPSIQAVFVQTSYQQG